MEREFKGVWIPSEIYLHKDLSWTEKILITEIDSLSNLELGCFAGNAYFAEFLGCSQGRVSNIISSLVEKGFLERRIVYKVNSKEIEKRYLKVKTLDVPINENVDTYPRKSVDPYPRKREEGIHENVEDNNSFNNSSFINSNTIPNGEYILTNTVSKEDNNIYIDNIKEEVIEEPKVESELERRLRIRNEELLKLQEENKSEKRRLF